MEKLSLRVFPYWIFYFVELYFIQREELDLGPTALYKRDQIVNIVYAVRLLELIGRRNINARPEPVTRVFLCTAQISYYDIPPSR